MKHFGRLLLFVAALAVGGGLGHLLLSDFDPVKMIFFIVCCLALGEVFHWIDRKITKR